ncbi:MAG: HEAT repeat domain-containing protein [Firmicutes bacterium]|nr:HEAT repeat domain-containing protein [Bacillota bacterium]
MPSLSEALKETVLAAGIDLVGITSAEPLPAHRAVYPHRQPREVLAGARAVVVAGFCVAYEPRLFGCGECLLACPRNERVAPRRSYPVPIDEFCDSPELIPLLDMTGDDFRRLIPAFPRRAGIDAIRGNAIIALGNIGDPAAVPALGRTLRHEKAQIRAYSAWALGRIGGAEAKALLREALAGEEEPRVREEIEGALALS